MEYYEFRAMNTDILLAAEGEPEEMASAFERTRAFIAAMEERMTRFTDHSELARLNRSAGNWFSASPELYEVVARAHDLVGQTDGLFNPAILDALEQAGYDRSMDELREHGTTRAPTAPSPVQGSAEEIELDRTGRRIRMPAGMRIDLGGIAKGWIADKAAHLLSAWTDACAVNAGGDMALIGRPKDEPVWQVGLEDPLHPPAVLAVLRVGPGSVATSSIAKRRWNQGGRTLHHLIDPRTGAPAETDWLSVTVVAPDAVIGEVFAKALLIAGSRQAESIAARRNDIAYIAVDASTQLWGSSNSKELLDVAAEYA